MRRNNRTTDLGITPAAATPLRLDVLPVPPGCIACTAHSPPLLLPGAMSSCRTTSIKRCGPRYAPTRHTTAYDMIDHPKAESGFQLTSLSGSLLLPDLPLHNIKAVAVKVAPDMYDHVMQAYQDFAEVGM